jgi:Uma2 family endonuclease
LTDLLTVEQFDALPEPSGGYYELRHGEAVFVSFPGRAHKEIQRRLLELLALDARNPGVVDTEFPYRPYAEHELWSADVAYVNQAAYDRIGRWLVGSPDLAAEVKSPPNTDKELQDSAMVPLAGGCKGVLDRGSGTASGYRLHSREHSYLHGSGRHPNASPGRG